MTVARCPVSAVDKDDGIEKPFIWMRTRESVKVLMHFRDTSNAKKINSVPNQDSVHMRTYIA